MIPVAENLEVEKNNFSKWLNLGFAIVCVFASIFIYQQKAEVTWYAILGAVLFGGIYYQNIKNKIITEQHGFSYIGLFGNKEIQWKEITAIDYGLTGSTKSVELKLKITYGPSNKNIEFSVKQFKKKQMLRFLEMLNEQCLTASKNEHFLKQAAGNLTWKEQLKMLYK